MTFEVLNKYKTNGEFTFRQGNKLSEFCKAVPHSAGVYIFSTIKGVKETLVYIGASGTMHQNGNFGNQLMKRRLQNMQSSKIRRQIFFEAKLEQNNLDAIRVNWFVTFDKENQDLPMFIEGQLIQTYFNMYRKLPEWNRKY